MNKPSPTDLILNADGSVYHLNLKPENISDIIFTVGDPGRVYRVSSHFESIDFEMNKREFITHTGIYKGKRVTVMSTGMGAANIEILMTELDILANYDFKNEKFKTKRKKLNIIRLGTSGSIQSDLPVGSILLSEIAVGLDNLMAFYNFKEEEDLKEISDKINELIHLDIHAYTVKCNKSLMEKFEGDPFVKGLTLTCPGFYAPQGRELKIQIKDNKIIDKLNYFNHNGNWLTNIEMETSAYYAFGQLLGHNTLSLNAILANRISARFSKNPYKIIDRMIKLALDRAIA
jgi:uridine phosphorylase